MFCLRCPVRLIFFPPFLKDSGKTCINTSIFLLLYSFPLFWYYTLKNVNRLSLRHVLHKSMITGLLNKLNIPGCHFILMPKVLQAPGSQVTTISLLPCNSWALSSGGGVGHVCLGEGEGGYLIPLPFSALLTQVVFKLQAFSDRRHFCAANGLYEEK